MCLFNDAELNWVSTNMRLILLLMQLLMGMSTSRYLPAMGTAGFDRLEVNGYNRLPAPPPRITATTEFEIVVIWGNLSEIKLILW